MGGKIDNGNFVDTIKNKTLFDRSFPKISIVARENNMCFIPSGCYCNISFPFGWENKTKLQYSVFYWMRPLGA